MYDDGDGTWMFLMAATHPRTHTRTCKLLQCTTAGKLPCNAGISRPPPFFQALTLEYRKARSGFDLDILDGRERAADHQAPVVLASS